MINPMTIIDINIPAPIIPNIVPNISIKNIVNKLKPTEHGGNLLFGVLQNLKCNYLLEKEELWKHF